MNHALMLVGWDVTGVKVTGNVQEATALEQSSNRRRPKKWRPRVEPMTAAEVEAIARKFEI